MLDKNKPAIMTARSVGNTSFSSSGEVSQACSNFYKFEDLLDSSTSNVVSAILTNAANIEEQLPVMMQTIEVLKKSVEDKDLQIAQLMNKLKLYNRGESSHKPTQQEKKFESSKLVEVPSLKKALNTFKLDDHSKDKDSETWTLVSHNRHNHKKRFEVSNSKGERKHKSSANMKKHKVQRQELVQ
ncbi:hypothetical protein K7X08_006338 [Anisodus acutangulus]|uniref:Uncharacterized protein n=1 Tax=Anisodus acutangulus TaxID=402998 RepID=A0A9Q1N177_9SOLA|nr:hypothetical protein K7X08_006338 [Anisodus acutangulus]